MNTGKETVSQSSPGNHTILPEQSQSQTVNLNPLQNDAEFSGSISSSEVSTAPLPGLSTETTNSAESLEPVEASTELSQHGVTATSSVAAPSLSPTLTICGNVVTVEPISTQSLTNQQIQIKEETMNKESEPANVQLEHNGDNTTMTTPNKDPIPFTDIPYKIIYAISMYLPKLLPFQSSCKKISNTLKNEDFRISWLKQNCNSGFVSLLIGLALDCLRNSTVRDPTWKSFKYKLDSGFSASLTYVPDLFKIRTILLSSQRGWGNPHNWLSQRVCRQLIEYYGPSLALSESGSSFLSTMLTQDLETSVVGHDAESKRKRNVESEEIWPHAEKLLIEADVRVRIMASLVMIAGWYEWYDEFKVGATFLVTSKLQHEQIQTLLPFIYQSALMMGLRRDASSSIREFLEILALRPIKTALETSSLFFLMLWASKFGESWVFTDIAVNNGIANFEISVIRFSSQLLLSAVCSQHWNIANFIMSLLENKNVKVSSEFCIDPENLSQRTVSSVWKAMSANLIEIDSITDQKTVKYPINNENPDRLLFESQIVEVLGGRSSAKENNYPDGLLASYLGRSLAELAYIIIYTPAPSYDSVGKASSSSTISPVPLSKPWPGNVIDDAIKVAIPVEQSKEEVRRESASSLYTRLLAYAQSYFPTADLLKCYAKMLSNARELGLYTFQYCADSLKGALGDVAVIFEALNYFKDQSREFSPMVFSRDIDAGYYLLLTSFSPYAGAIVPIIPNLREKIRERYFDFLETFLCRQLCTVSGPVDENIVSWFVCNEFEQHNNARWTNLYGEENVSAPEVLREQRIEFDGFGIYKTSDKREILLSLLSWVLGIQGSEVIFRKLLDSKIAANDFNSVDVLMLAMKQNGGKIYCSPGELKKLQKVAQRVKYDPNPGRVYVSLEAVNAGFGNTSYEELRLSHLYPELKNDEPVLDLQYHIPQLVRWQFMFQGNFLKQFEFVDIPVSFFQKNPPFTYANIHDPSKPFVEIRRHFAATLIVFTAFSAALPMMNLLCVEWKVDVKWLKLDSKLDAAERLWRLSMRSYLYDELDEVFDNPYTDILITGSTLNVFLQLEKSKMMLAPMIFLKRLLIDGISAFEVSRFLEDLCEERPELCWNAYIAAAAVGWRDAVDLIMNQASRFSADDLRGLVTLSKLCKRAKEEQLLQKQTKFRTPVAFNGVILWLPDFVLKNQKYPGDKRTNETNMTDVPEKLLQQSATHAVNVTKFEEAKKSDRNEMVRIQLYYYMCFTDFGKQPDCTDSEKTKGKKLLDLDVGELERALEKVIDRIAEDEGITSDIISKLIADGNGDVCVRLISAWREKRNGMNLSKSDHIQLVKDSLNLPATKFEFQSSKTFVAQSGKSEAFPFGISFNSPGFTFAAFGKGEIAASNHIHRTPTNFNGNHTFSTSSPASSTIINAKSSSPHMNNVQSKTKLSKEMEKSLLRIVLESIEMELKTCCEEYSYQGVSSFSKKNRIENGLLHLFQHLDFTSLADFEGWKLLIDVINTGQNEGSKYSNPRCPGYSKCITRATIVSALLWGGVGRGWVDDIPLSGYFVPTEVIFLINEEFRPKKQDVLRIIDAVRSCYQNQMPIDFFKSWNSGPPSVTQYLDPNAAATATAIVNAPYSSLHSPQQLSIFSISSATATKTATNVSVPGSRLKKRLPKPTVPAAKLPSEKSTKKPNSFTAFNFNPSSQSIPQELKSGSAPSTFAFSGNAIAEFPVLEQSSLPDPKPLSMLFASFGTKPPRPQFDLSTPTLDGIPEYVHVDIFGYLTNPKDIGELAKVSKKLREISKDRYIRLQWLLRHPKRWVNGFIHESLKIENDSFVTENTTIHESFVQERTWKNLLYSASPAIAPFPAKILDEEISIAILRCHINFLVLSLNGSEKRNSLMKAISICAINRRQCGAYDEYFELTYKDSLDAIVDQHNERKLKLASTENEKKGTLLPFVVLNDRTKEFLKLFIRNGIVNGIVNNDARFIKHIILKYGTYLDTVDSNLWKPQNLAIGLGLWAAENGEFWVFADLGDEKSELGAKESDAMVLESNTSEDVNEIRFLSEFLKRHCMNHWFMAWETIVRSAVINEHWNIFDTFLRIADMSDAWARKNEVGIQNFAASRISNCADILIELIKGLISSKSKIADEFDRSPDSNLQMQSTTPALSNGVNVNSESKSTEEDYHRRIIVLLKAGLRKYPGHTLFSNVILETIPAWNVDIMKYLILYCIELPGEVDDAKFLTIDSPIYKLVYAYLNVLNDATDAEVLQMLKSGLSMFVSYPFIKEIDSTRPAVFKTLEDSAIGFVFVLRNFVIERTPKLITLMHLLNTWSMLLTHFFVTSYSGPVAEKLWKNRGTATAKESDSASIVFFLVEMLRKYPRDVNVIMQMLPIEKRNDQVFISEIFTQFWMEGSWEIVEKLVQWVNLLESDYLSALFNQVRIMVSQYGLLDGRSREFERLMEITQDIETGAKANKATFVPMLFDDTQIFYPQIPSKDVISIQSITIQQARNMSFEELRISYISTPPRSPPTAMVSSRSLSYFRPIVYQDYPFTSISHTITLHPEFLHLSVEELRMGYYSIKPFNHGAQRTERTTNGKTPESTNKSIPNWTMEETSRLLTVTSKLIKWKINMIAEKSVTSTTLELMLGSVLEFIENLDLRGEIGGSLLIISINLFDLTKNSWMPRQLISFGANILSAPVDEIVKLMNLALRPQSDLFGSLARMLFFSVLFDSHTSFDRSLIKLEKDCAEEGAMNFIISLIVLGFHEEAWVEIGKKTKWVLKSDTLKKMLNLLSKHSWKEIFLADKESSSSTLPILYLIEKTLEVPVQYHDPKLRLPTSKMNSESELLKVDVKKVEEFLKKLLDSHTAMLNEESEKDLREYFQTKNEGTSNLVASEDNVDEEKKIEGNSEEQTKMDID